VYSLAIVARSIPALGRTAREKWYHHYKITDVESQEWVIEGLEFIAVELPKFRPETWSQTDKRMAVLWLRFLKEVSGSDGVADELLQEKEIKQAISICEVGAYTREELAYYDKYLDAAMWEASRGTLECDLAAAREALAEKEDVIAEQSSVIAEQGSALAEKENALAEKEGVIAEQSAEMKKLLERIAQLERKP
jgi:uncharacterized coiled-coil protein SlyX